MTLVQCGATNARRGFGISRDGRLNHRHKRQLPGAFTMEWSHFEHAQVGNTHGDML